MTTDINDHRAYERELNKLEKRHKKVNAKFKDLQKKSKKIIDARLDALEELLSIEREMNRVKKDMDV